MAERSETSPVAVEAIITKADLIEQFRNLGLTRGTIVYVQSTLDQCKGIIGGNRTIIEALQDVVTFEGGIVTSSFTPELIDPLCTRHYYPIYALDMLRESMPPFNKKKSLSNNPLANVLMTYEGVYRSYHPLHSFTAWGKYAKLICDQHPLHFSLGKDSPLGKVCELNGFVLLLGTRYDQADIFKVARVNDQDTPIKVYNSPIEKRGRLSFISMLDYDYRYKDLGPIINSMEERQVVNYTVVANKMCRLFSAKEAYNLANAYFLTHKEGLL